MHRKGLMVPLLGLLLTVSICFALPLTAGIIRLTPQNSVVETLAGSGSPGSRDGFSGNSWFQWPTGLVADAEGSLYVADFNNNQIRKVSRNGTVTTLAGTGLGGHADGTALEAMFHGPETVAFGPNGNLYVADSENFRIRKITHDGMVSTIAGSDHSSYVDGMGKHARFVYPTGITVDRNGMIYVADRGSHTIRKITPDGIVTTFAGDGTPGYRDGPGTKARFHDPLSVVVDASQNFYVVDSGNHSIRKITPSGEVTTYAGSQLPGFRDGPASHALFHWPTGIALDQNGDLYVSDSNNSRIRKINPQGVVMTLAGTGVPGYTNGPGRSARFNFPTGLGIDRSGNLYIADSANHLIRRITAGQRQFVQNHGDTFHDDG